MKKDKLQLLADELKEVIADREEIESLTLAPLKEREDILRIQLAKGLLAKGFSYVKTSDGSGFGVVDGRKTYLIKKGLEQQALEWAKAEYPSVLSINKTDLAKVLKPMLTIPAFFEEKVGEPYLQVRSATKDEA